MRAVVKYPVEATDDEKIRELRRGLTEIGYELAELQVDPDTIQQWYEEAADEIEFVQEQEPPEDGVTR